MKISIFLLSLFMLSSLMTLLHAQGGSTDLQPIDLDRRKVYHKGKQVKNVNDLLKVIEQSNNQEAIQFMKRHKTNATIAAVPMWTGVGVSVVGLGIQLDALSEEDPSDIEEQSNKGLSIVLAGSLLTLSGAIATLVSWKNNGVKAIGIYNSIANQKDKKGTSLHLIPSSQSLGVGLGLTF